MYRELWNQNLYCFNTLKFESTIEVYTNTVSIVIEVYTNTVPIVIEVQGFR